MALLIVGHMSHTGPVTTVSGASDDWSDMLEKATMPFSFAASMTPKRSAKMASTPASICASAASFAFGGSKNEPMKENRHLASLLTSLAPAQKALASRLTSGIGMAATTPILFDLVSLPAIMPER